MSFATGFKSFLSAVGDGLKKAWGFIISPQGQAIIKTGEGVATVAIGIADPALSVPLAGAFTLSNTLMTKAIQVEALAASSGAQSSTGAQKLAAVTSAVTPDVLAFCQQHGLATPTAEQIQAMVNASVAFLNALPAGAPTTPVAG